MGLFDKIKQGMRKTREIFSGRMVELVENYQELDDDFYEDLSDILIMADVGMKTTELAVGRLKEKCKAEKIGDPAKARDALKEAWALTEARGGVLDAVLSLEHLTDMLPERLGQAAKPLTQAQVQELDEFEARRLKALQELDRLAQARADKRRELLDEVKQENAIELRRLEKQNQQARAEAQ